MQKTNTQNESIIIECVTKTARIPEPLIFKCNAYIDENFKRTGIKLNFSQVVNMALFDFFNQGGDGGKSE